VCFLQYVVIALGRQIELLPEKIGLFGKRLVESAVTTGIEGDLGRREF
jgi:hypothetical protein